MRVEDGWTDELSSMLADTTSSEQLQEFKAYALGSAGPVKNEQVAKVVEI